MPWRNLSIVLTLFASAAVCAEQDVSAEEALFLRRISEFWQEGDYARVKAQIAEFLTEEPNSASSDLLKRMLGDLQFNEKAYREALASYDSIQSEVEKEKSLLNSFRSMAALNENAALLKCGRDFLSKTSTLKENEVNEIRFLFTHVLYDEMQQCSDLEEKHTIAEETLRHLTLLEETNYSNDVILPLAICSELLDKRPEAAAFYLRAAEAHPEQAELAKVRAAHLFSKFEPETALKLFHDIANRGEKYEKEALFNELLLLFQFEDYGNFLNRYVAKKDSLSEEDKGAVLYMRGRALFAQSSFHKASASFSDAIQTGSLSPEQVKGALLKMMLCAQKTNDLNEADIALSKLNEAFPLDLETCKAHLIHSQIALKKEELDVASRDFNHILTFFPHYDGNETIAYDYAITQCKQGHLEEGRNALCYFVKTYPSSIFAKDAWRALLATSLKIENEKEQLISDLENTLEQKDVLSAVEREKYRYLVISLLHEKGNETDAIRHLDLYVKEFPEGENISKAHELLGIFYQKGEEHEDLFILHTEKALGLAPTAAQKARLHLQLFNAYLKQSEKSAMPTALHEKAAEHLYQSFLLDPQAIEKQNQFWLANFYLEKTKEELFAKRAFSLYDHLFPEQENKVALKIDSAHLFLEAEALKFSELCKALGEEQKRFAVLEALYSQQQEKSDLTWKFARQTAFDLAGAYEALGNDEKALEIYEDLSGGSLCVSSYIANAALLQKARLEYRRGNKSQEELDHIFNALKDLQLKKKLAAEPIHIEAALDYVSFKTATFPLEEQKNERLKLLKRLEADFSSEEDVLSKQYQEARKLYPEKSALLDLYLTYVDLEIRALEGKVKRKRIKALKENPLITPYLKSCLERNLS